MVPGFLALVKGAVGDTEMSLLVTEVSVMMREVLEDKPQSHRTVDHSEESSQTKRMVQTKHMVPPQVVERRTLKVY